MKKNEIKVGGFYRAKVNGRVVTVKVTSMGLGGLGRRQVTTYQVVNTETGRKTMFRSAAKFRGPATIPSSNLRADGSVINPNDPQTIAAVAQAEQEELPDSDWTESHKFPDSDIIYDGKLNPVGRFGEEADPLRPTSPASAPDATGASLDGTAFERAKALAVALLPSERRELITVLRRTLG